MNILVTGGAGFVGTNLIKKLLQLNHTVTSLDNYSTGTKENHLPDVAYIEGDVTSTEINGDFDLVFHLAAIARIQPSFERPLDYFNTNGNGTFRLAMFCYERNIPLIYAGSSSHHSGRYKNPYTFSKDVGEDIIKLYQNVYNLKSSIVRFYNVYGPNQLTEGGYTTLIGRWIKRREENQPLVIYGDGSKRRDFTHVNDIVNGLISIMEKKAWDSIFELGAGKNYSILEVAKMFNHPYIFDEDKPGEAEVTLCDYSYAKKVLGWEPKISLENYLKELINE